MEEIQGFPKELLSQPFTQRLEYFRTLTLAHPLLQTSYQTLSDELANPNSGSLIMVLGPSGVGKTTLSQKIVRESLINSMPILQQNLGCIPIVGVEAIAPETGNFNWKDFYYRTLNALNEPLLDYKINHAPEILTSQAIKLNKHSKYSASTELRRSLEKALDHRSTKTLIIDEAQHLTKMASGRKLQDQLDTLKSLSNVTGTTLVLFGTYELLRFRNLSGQLSRRSIDIHFPRYRADKADDIEAFISVLWSFQKHLPLEKEPSLINSWEFFYERTIGCIGILKEWLLRSLALALNDQAKTLSVSHLKKRALSLDQCEKMVTDALLPEAELEENEEKRAHLQMLLGMKESSEMTEVLTEKSSNKNRRVGERKPTRDPVGGIQHAN